MVDAVIFDWAGTTVDYGCFAPVRAFMATFEQAGVAPTVEETRKPMGMLKIDHIRTMLKMPRIHDEWTRVHGAEPTEADVQALYEPYEQMLLASLDNYAEPKPYVLEAVDALRAAGAAIGSTTGYNDKMMEIVTREAAKRGYAPDFTVTPDGAGGKGRPYPYMVFRNMEALGCADVRRVAKVGDTVADIEEGKNAGVITVGVVDGSSVMAMSREEFEGLSDAEREAARERVARTFREAGADAVIHDFRELPALLEALA